MNGVGILSVAIQGGIRSKDREILKLGLAGRNAGNVFKGRVIDQGAHLNVIRLQPHGFASVEVKPERR